MVRTANAFAVDTVHIVGRRRWNRRGAMVTDRYQRLRHHDTTADLLAFAADAGLTVVAVDNVPGAQRLEETALPRDCLLVFGQEGPGITDDAKAGAALTVSIAQFGSTRSINAARRGGHRDAHLDQSNTATCRGPGRAGSTTWIRYGRIARRALKPPSQSGI